MAIEKMKSQSQLQQNLADILAPLQSEAASLAQTLKGSLLASISLQDAGAGLTFCGGSPVVPPSFRWPTDKSGQNMTFIAQLDFKSLPALASMPEDGLLLIFRAHNRAAILPKERHSFNLTYLSEGSRDALTPRESQNSTPARYLSGRRTYTINSDKNWLNQVIQNLATTDSVKQRLLSELIGWTSDFNEAALPPGSIQMGGFCADLTALKEMASFSASGITYSADRASDWHYKHLVEHCQDYKLLFKMDDGHGKLSVLIKDEDLSAKNFDRAWLFLST